MHIAGVQSVEGYGAAAIIEPDNPARPFTVTADGYESAEYRRLFLTQLFHADETIFACTAPEQQRWNRRYLEEYLEPVSEQNDQYRLIAGVLLPDAISPTHFNVGTIVYEPAATFHSLRRALNVRRTKLWNKLAT